MKTLNRKALRDLWHMRGQMLAIALVIATGVAVLVMSQATLLSLKKTQNQLYTEQRFSQLWVTVKRAPLTMLKRIAHVPGVEEVEGRLITGAKLTVRNFDEPVTALIQSLPQQQNKLFLRSGRLPETSHEILLNETFAKAHDFSAGEKIHTIVHGRAQWFTVSGIAVSAEYLYQVKPGTLFPDFKRYAIIWAPENSLAAALDMQGAFNQAILRLTPQANKSDVIAEVDRLLAPYGSTGALGRDNQMSHAVLNNEFKELTVMATFFPAIFLAVATFLLNIVFKRLIGIQRDQIAIIKAFGYSTRQVTMHYAFIVTLITLFGVLLGVACGTWLGHGLAALYQKSFHFPYLRFVLDWRVAGIGAIVSLLAALTGTAYAVYAAASEPVAEAMRPPAPQHFRRTILETIGLSRILSPSTRMVWRQLERHPIKALLTIVAIAFASAIVMMTQFQRAAIEHVAAVEFRLANRHDIAATLVEARPMSVLNELRAIDGVEQAEGIRRLPVRIYHNNQNKLVTLEGIPSDSQLRHLINTESQSVPLPEKGLVLDDMLADILDVQVGESVWVDILEGRQQHLHLPVVKRVPSYTGLAAYMDFDALNHSLGDSDLINNVRLTVTSGKEKAVLRTLDEYPQILGAEERSTGLAALQKMLDENMTIFTQIVLIMGMIVNFGILYNTVRMNLSEHSRELASLRVLGLSKGEIAYILFGELAILVILSIPLGLLFGYALSVSLAESFQNDLYRFPFIIYPSAYPYTALVTIVSAFLSALAVYPRIHNLNLIEVLKTRE